jgi:hypothetical protein
VKKRFQAIACFKCNVYRYTQGAASAELLAMWSEAAVRPSGSVVASDIFASVGTPYKLNFSWPIA